MHIPKSVPLALALMLTVPLAMAEPASRSAIAQRLQELLGSSAQDELLDPERAFGVKLHADSSSVLRAELTPAPGYYLYRDRIKFVLQDAAGASIRSVALPRGTVKQDPTFGTTETYNAPIEAEIRLQRTAEARTVTVLASYQGCHEKSGVCYPPQEKVLKVALPAVR